MTPLNELKKRVDKSGENGIALNGIDGDLIHWILDEGEYVAAVSKTMSYNPIVKMFRKEFAPKP